VPAQLPGFSFGMGYASRGSTGSALDINHGKNELNGYAIFRPIRIFSGGPSPRQSRFARYPVLIMPPVITETLSLTTTGAPQAFAISSKI
jgi:hypothetical protein